MVTGKCSLKDGVRLQAQQSGVEVVPYDVSTHDAQGDYKWLRAEISEPAGKAFIDNAIHREPVKLIAGGVTINRYLFTDGAVELSDDRAFLKLQDALKIFEDGPTISEEYNDEETLEYIVKDIVEMSKTTFDSSNMITGVRFDDSDDEFVEYMGTVENLVDGDGISAVWSGGSGGFDFEASPLDALNKIANEIGVEIAVDRNGVLVFGNHDFIKQETNAGLYTLTGDTAVDVMRISQYNVTRGGSPLSSAAFKTPQYSGSELEEVFDEAGFNTSGALGNEIANYEMQGFAAAFADIDAKRQEIDTHRTYSMDELKARAVGVYYNSWGGFANGNIVYNTGGSHPQGQHNLARTDPGDLLNVVPSKGPIPDSETFTAGNQSLCGQRVYGGQFSISEVKHNFNSRVGWETITSTSLLPPEAPQVESYWVMLHNQGGTTRYDELREAYNEITGRDK